MGRSADLVAVAVSYDKGNRYGLQTPFSEDLSRLWAGGMWHVDATHNTFITTGNAGSEATAPEVTLFHNGGKSRYRMEKMLSPGQQLWLDVGRAIRDQVPDSDGHTLPPATMTGSYELRDLDHATVGQLYEGKLVIDETYGHAAYGCGSCCGYDAVVLDPSSYGGPPGIDSDDYIYANDTCVGEQVDVTDSGYGWASSDTAVATLPSRTLHTVAVGSATGSTLAKLQWAHPPSCPTQTFGPEQPVTVQKPTITSFDPNPIMIGVSGTSLTINGSGFGTSPTVNLPWGINSTGQGSTDSQIVMQGVSVSFSAKIGSNNVTVTAGSQTSAPASLGINGPNQMVVQSDTIATCVGAPYQCRFVSYTVENYDGTLAANIPIAENISFSGYNCQQANPGSTTAQCNAQYTTDGGGNLTDEWAMYTGFTPAGCGENLTDHWQWCGPTGNNPDPGITFGTLVGYSHTASTDINGFINPPNKIPTGTVFGP